MNFNFQDQPEYDLNTSLVEEMIDLYGVLTKFMVVEKINVDDVVFGDYSHIKSNSTDIFDIFMLPENTEDWDQSEFQFNNFGLMNFDNITLFAAKSSFSTIFNSGDPALATSEPSDKLITGNLLILPNNKIMEVTNTELAVPGINNLFTEQNAKTVYKLTCKPYDSKLINELDNNDISVSDDSYESLDNYFNELIQDKVDQETEAEVTNSVDSIIKNDSSDDVKTQKPIIDKSEDTVWGEF